MVAILSARSEAALTAYRILTGKRVHYFLQHVPGVSAILNRR